MRLKLCLNSHFVKKKKVCQPQKYSKEGGTEKSSSVEEDKMNFKSFAWRLGLYLKDSI